MARDPDEQNQSARRGPLRRDRHDGEQRIARRGILRGVAGDPAGVTRRQGRDVRDIAGE